MNYQQRIQQTLDNILGEKKESKIKRLMAREINCPTIEIENSYGLALVKNGIIFSELPRDFFIAALGVVDS